MATKRKSGDKKYLEMLIKNGDKLSKDWGKRQSELTAYARQIKLNATRSDSYATECKKAADSYKKTAAQLKAAIPKLEKAEKELADAENSGDKAEIRKKKQVFDQIDAQIVALEGTLSGDWGGYIGNAMGPSMDMSLLKVTEPKLV